MAIDIEWQVKPPHNGKEEGQPQMFPRIANGKVIGEQELAGIMAKNTSYTRGMAKALLDDLSVVMSDLLREGNTIDIPSLGTFRLSLGTDSKVTPSTDAAAQKVAVRGINFRPSKAFMQLVSTPSFRTVARNAVPVVPSAARLLPALSGYLDVHGSITSAEFARIFSLKRSTASLRLQQLIGMGAIKAVGHHRGTRYVKS